MHRRPRAPGGRETGPPGGGRRAARASARRRRRRPASPAARPPAASAARPVPRAVDQRQLDDRAGARLAHDPVRRNGASNRERRQVAVEEDDVDARSASPKVWTLRQRGISRPSPARSGRSSASPSRRERRVTATGTRRDATSARGSRRKRSGRSEAVTPPTTPCRPTVPPPRGDRGRALEDRGSDPSRSEPPFLRRRWCKPSFSIGAAAAPATAIGEDARTWEAAAGGGPRKSENCGKGNSQRQLRVRVRLRPRVRRAALLIQRGGLRPAGRAGRREARLRRRRPARPRSFTTCSSWPSTARSASRARRSAST